ncbi:MAG: 1-acyl-sn-glycerol-3-phosphate acyltransferase [Candidatus Rokubacteria bacterium]|nr:1-acyl-sn-glycerol-3-phosphate acyltransferase [Candidatus Rokubacteria bacterium]
MTAPAGGETVDGLYAAARRLARFWLWVLFKRIEVRHSARVPARGPALLCINHPNNLIDSLLVGAVVSRKVHYLATAALFRHPLQARFLRACGAIPIYRREDDPTRPDRNAEAFAACGEALARGQLIAIYPEGTTHAESRVQRIKTGAARLALEHEARRAAGHAVEPLVVVPVGLVFAARKSFRSRVEVSFGAPVPVLPHLSRYREEPVTAVQALTADIQDGMEQLVVHVDRLDAAELARAVESLYGDDLVRALQEERGLAPREIDHVRLSRAVVAAVGYFERREPTRVADIRARIEAYQALLAAYRVQDQAVRRRLARAPAMRERLRHGWEASAGLPIFAYGALANALPYVVPRVLARWTARKETDYATTRFLASVVAIPLFWGLETWLVWRLAGGGWAIAFALSLPVTGILAYHYLIGLERLGASVRLGFVALTRRQAASRLLTERRALVAELERARADYLAASRATTP